MPTPAAIIARFLDSQQEARYLDNTFLSRDAQKDPTWFVLRNTYSRHVLQPGIRACKQKSGDIYTRVILL